MTAAQMIQASLGNLKVSIPEAMAPAMTQALEGTAKTHKDLIAKIKDSLEIIVTENPSRPNTVLAAANELSPRGGNLIYTMAESLSAQNLQDMMSRLVKALAQHFPK